MELSTPVIIGIVVLVLAVLIILIVVGVLASKRSKARQQEADRLRAAELRDEAKAQQTAVQERDLQARETELEADRARLDAEKKAKVAEQEQIAAERRHADAETQRAAVDQERGTMEERLAEADRLDPSPESPGDAPRRTADGAPIAAAPRHEPLRDDHDAAHDAVHDGVHHGVHDGAHDGVSRDHTARDGALTDDPERSSGHGRRAARPVGEEPPIGDAPDRTPGAAEADEQDPLFPQQRRDRNGDLPPEAPEHHDPQDGSHRG